MDIPKPEYRLQDTSGMSIHLLDTIETTLSNCTGKGWYLLDSYDTRVSDDDDIELIIDPVEKDKCQKYDPVQRESSPVESLKLEDIDDSSFVCEKYPWTQEEQNKVKKMKYKDNPVTVKCQDDFFIIF